MKRSGRIWNQQKSTGQELSTDSMRGLQMRSPKDSKE
jgi:hypothetical protein